MTAMKTAFRFLTAMAALAVTAVSCNVVPQFGSAPVEKIIRAMSIEDKAAMVVVYSSDGCTHAVPEMGIPSVVFQGKDFEPALSEPMLAQTWNVMLAAESGRAAAGEMISHGADCFTPSWSGTSPCAYSANAVLSGRMSSALIDGIRSAGAGSFLDCSCDGSRMASALNSPWAVFAEYDSLYDRAREIREQWNCQGLIATHGTGNVKAWEMILAGYDMVFTSQQTAVSGIVEAVENVDLDEDVLDAAVARVLEFVMRSTGQRDGSEPALSVRPDLNAEIAAQSVVLLKNDGTLPYSGSVRNIALYGPESYFSNLDGTLLASGFRLDPSITSMYARHSSEKEMNESMLRKPYQLRADAIGNEAALVVIGRQMGGESVLSDPERQLVSDVCDAFHSKNRKVTVLLSTPVPVETESWESCADAVIQTVCLSRESDQAVSDIISGRKWPSGRLAGEWPSYPFGYGLSYTAFTYSDDVCMSAGGRTTMSVKVTNSGNAAGMHSVLFYDTASEPENLLGFAKTGILEPGESQIVELTVADSVPQAVVGPLFF